MFQLELGLYEDENPSAENIVFSQGYITIITDNRTISSKNTGAPWIFEGVKSLLGGLKGLIENEHWQTCEFSFIESSFKFTFVRKKQKPNEIKLFFQGDFIQTCQTQEIVQAFWNEASRFVRQYQTQLENELPENYHLRDELYRFLEEFGKFLDEK